MATLYRLAARVASGVLLDVVGRLIARAATPAQHPVQGSPVRVRPPPLFRGSKRDACVWFEITARHWRDWFDADTRQRLSTFPHAWPESGTVARVVIGPVRRTEHGVYIRLLCSRRGVLVRELPRKPRFT
jgi:hypothetical protein